jgi:DNA end-binding protein Ku
MARPIWKGQIAFGLVNVPVSLHSAEKHVDVKFHLVDSRDSARVKYERVNEDTGDEVPWDKIAKAYEYKDGNYVVLSDEELQSAAVAMTKIIEIEQFVDAAEIDPFYFEKPYYLVPEKAGVKGYVLLRAALEKSAKAGMAKVVIRTRQYLAALFPRDEALVLNLMRFDQEVRKPDEFDLPSHDLRQHKVTAKEIELAAQLINGMTSEWRPAEFQDEYRSQLTKLIQRKITAGDTEEIESPPGDEEEVSTINFMDALKKSLKQSVTPGTEKDRQPKRTSGAGKKTEKKRTASVTKAAEPTSRKATKTSTKSRPTSHRASAKKKAS